MVSRSLVLFLLVSVLSACAPGLGSELKVSSIPLLDDHPLNKIGSLVTKVQVDPFSDSRTDMYIAEIDGRKLAPRGDVGLSVQSAFQRYLKIIGADAALFRAPIVSGDVRRWHVSIRPGFPSTEINAVAEIDVAVTNPTGDVLYRASYSGEVSSKEPFPTERKVQKLLGTAMSQAVREAVSDHDLLQKLSQYSSAG